MEKKKIFLLIPSPFAISNLLQKNLYHVRKDSMDEEREKGGRGMRRGELRSDVVLGLAFAFQGYNHT